MNCPDNKTENLTVWYMWLPLHFDGSKRGNIRLNTRLDFCVLNQGQERDVHRPVGSSDVLFGSLVDGSEGSIKCCETYKQSVD